MSKNLMPIKKGASWSFKIQQFQYADETGEVDLSTTQFVFTALYANGTQAFLKVNSDFVVDGLGRVVTLSKTETAALTAGELYYQIDVTYPNTTSEEWSDGYIAVLK